MALAFTHDGLLNQFKNKKKKKLVLSKSFPSQTLPGVQDLELIDFLLHDA